MKAILAAGVALTALAFAAPASAELKFKPGEDSRFNWANYEELDKVDLSGQTLTVFGPWRGPDEDLVQSILEYFREATGATVNYSSSENYEQQIVIDTQAGSPPNIAILPQPGLIQDLASKGLLVPLNDADAQFVAQNYGAGESWVDLGTYKDKDGTEKFFAFPYKADLKSLVWYSPENFEEAGYEVPQNWDELMKLQDQIVADGGVPWCIGLGSGGATGWPATDWVEDIMLRTTSLENYDAWTRGELPFTSPEVTSAVETMANIWLNEAYVYGGTGAIVSTFFGDAPAPMFEDPPRCWLHKQGNFITSFFPPETQAGVDYDFFYLPPIDDAYGRPFLIAGDLMAAFSDRPEVQALMEYFTYGDSVRAWLAAGGALSPHNDASLDWYGDDVERGIAGLVQESTAFRFDGSDLMPGEVGAGSFWKGMTDLIAGTVDVPTALQEIDAAWPR